MVEKLFLVSVINFFFMTIVPCVPCILSDLLVSYLSILVKILNTQTDWKMCIIKQVDEKIFTI